MAKTENIFGELGGGAKAKAGTFNITGVQTVTIDDVGFQPKYVAVTFQGASGTGSSSSNGAIRAIYDERISTTYCARGLYTSSATVDSASMTGAGSAISEVNANGFKYRNGVNNSYMYGTYYYFAIG